MARKQNAEEFVRFGSFRFAESFVGSRTYDLQDGKNINALAADQLALGTVYLSQAVPNFFFGVLPSNTSLGAAATTQRRNLLMPYPQFTTITEGRRASVRVGTTHFSSRLRSECLRTFGAAFVHRFKDDGTTRLSQPPRRKTLTGNRRL